MNPPPPIVPACVDAAAEATRAAQAIAADPACAPRSAAAPLAAAWHALARATTSRRDPPEDAAPEDWLPAELWAALSTHEREAQRRELPALLAEARRPPDVARSFPLTRSQLLAHAARLDRTIAALRAQHGGRQAGPNPWPRRLAALVGVLALAVLFVRPWQSESFGPWRGAYYSLPDLRGDVTIRHDLDLRFDWGRAPPMDAIPANKYSVRWDTCLTVDTPRKVPFQLTHDNHAKLYIDDRLVLNHRARRLQAHGVAVTLTPGVHHLRVEYHKTGGESHIGLTASLDGEPPQALPFSRLSAAHAEPGELATCD